jgi:hypothetical protein
MPFSRKIDKFVHHFYFIEHVPGREEPLRLSWHDCGKWPAAMQ